MSKRMTAEELLGVIDQATSTPATFSPKSGEEAQLKRGSRVSVSDILAYNPTPEPEAPRSKETLTRMALDTILPPSPQDVKFAGRDSYTDEGLRGLLVDHVVKPFETIGGNVAKATEGLNEPILSPLMGAGKELMSGPVTSPLMDEIGQWLNKKGLNPEGSTAAQFASGIPGALTEAAGNIGGNLIADAPAQAALTMVGGAMTGARLGTKPISEMLVGQGEGLGALAGDVPLSATAPGVSPFTALGQAVERVAPKLIYRGGQLPQSKIAGDILDRSGLAAGDELTTRVLEKALLTPEGKRLGRTDIDLIAGLMEEKPTREFLSSAGAKTYGAAPMDKYVFSELLDKGLLDPKDMAALSGESVPMTKIPLYMDNKLKGLYRSNRVGNLTKVRALHPAVVQAMQQDLAMPVATHAKIADELSKVFFATGVGGGKKGLAQGLEEVGATSPDTFARYTDKFLPWVRGKVVKNLTDGTAIEVAPNIASRTGRGGVRMNKTFLQKRGAQTEESRIKAGFLPPEQSIAIRFMQEKQLINQHKYLNTLAADPAVVRSPLTFPDRGASVVAGWKKMPNEEAYGPLKGMMVRAPEADDIMAANQFRINLPKTMKKWWSLWKFGKTVMSPKTHIRNFVSNGMLAHAAGLSPWRIDIYSQAAKELAEGGMWMEEAKTGGAEWAFKARGGSQIGEVYDFGKASNVYEAGLTSIPEKIMNNKNMQALANTYQDSERLFKHAVYIYLRRSGVAIDEAIQRASFGIINYDKMPWWLKEARSNPLGVPFASYTYGSIGPLTRALMEKPQIYAQYEIVIDAWNRMSAEAIGAKMEEVDKLTKYGGGMMPVFTPVRDASQGALVTDIAPTVPFGQLIPGRRTIGVSREVEGAATALGIPGVLGGALGAGLGALESTILSNPIYSEGIAQLSGVDTYFGNQFASPAGKVGGAFDSAQTEGLGDELDPHEKVTMQEILRKRASHLGRTLFPELAGGPFTQNMYEAVQGRENFLGDKIDPAMVGLSFLSPTGNAQSLDSMENRSQRNVMSLLPEIMSAYRAKYIREKGRNK